MGGLHHARPDRASGFCLYNDPAVAVAAVIRECDARVLYVDFDVHHGDGVQLCFEDEPRVLTVSFHESGQFLFPGTGDVEEVGRGAGRGFSVNVPFAPGTDDGSWIEALETLLPPLAARFGPDLIVSQHGCDTHAFDPLADLRLSTVSFMAQAHLVHRLAHERCAGRWLALGGGGYDIYGVVPRSWALLWAEMAERPLPELVPPAWRDRWQPEAPHPLPEHMFDRPEDIPATPASAAAAAQNRRTLEQVRKLHLASLPEPR
jgi:acetoin utilization protein AcuC